MRRWTVGDVMTGKVVSVTADTPYKQIVKSLQRHRVSAVPVVLSDFHADAGSSFAASLI